MFNKDLSASVLVLLFFGYSVLQVQAVGQSDPASNDYFKYQYTWQPVTDSVPLLRDRLGLSPDTHNYAQSPCRVAMNGGVQLGKLLADVRQCNVGYGGGSYVFHQFEELAGPAGGFWGRPGISDGRNGLEPVQGGQEADGTPRYVCRAKYNSLDFQIGKLVAGNCNFEWGGKEIASAVEIQLFYVHLKPAIGWFWMPSDRAKVTQFQPGVRVAVPNDRNISAEEGDLQDPNAEFAANRVVVCRSRLLNSLGLGSMFLGTLLRVKGQNTYECYGQNGAGASAQSDFDVAVLPKGYTGDWAPKDHPTTGVYDTSVLAGDNQFHALCLTHTKKQIGYTDGNSCYYGFDGKVLTDWPYDVFWCCRPGTPPAVVPRKQE